MGLTVQQENVRASFKPLESCVSQPLLVTGILAVWTKHCLAQH